MFFDRFVKYDGKVEPLTIDDYKILSDELIKNEIKKIFNNKCNIIYCEKDFQFYMKVCSTKRISQINIKYLIKNYNERFHFEFNNEETGGFSTLVFNKL